MFTGFRWCYVTIEKWRSQISGGFQDNKNLFFKSSSSFLKRLPEQAEQARLQPSIAATILVIEIKNYYISCHIKCLCDKNWHSMNGFYTQCFKHFTGLYLKVCKSRPILFIICGHKCCLFQNNIAFLLKHLVFKSENKTTHGFIIDF